MHDMASDNGAKAMTSAMKIIITVLAGLLLSLVSFLGGNMYVRIGTLENGRMENRQAIATHEAAQTSRDQVLDERLQSIDSRLSNIEQVLLDGKRK